MGKGYKVTALDNFFTGQRHNIRDIFYNENFDLIAHDICDPLPSTDTFDEIYNLACPASPVHYQFSPVKTVKANTLGVINVLEFAYKSGSRVLQASTSEIYGDPDVHPQVESYRGNVNTLGPRACYDEGKRVAETLFMDYHRKYGLDTRIVRIFNTYGPNMYKHDGRVISNFIVSCLTGEPITIYGSGNQTRSFCYVSDLVRGLIGVMEKQDEAEPFNLGNPNERTIQEIAETIRELTGSNVEIVYKDLPEDDPVRRNPLIDRVHEKIGWEPKIDLREGLGKTIQYFKDIL